MSGQYHLYPKITFSPRPPPRIILKEAWQVQRDSHQRGTRTGKPVADERRSLRLTSESKVLHKQKSIKKTSEPEELAHLVKNHSNQSALLKDLQTTDTYNPTSEESKKVIHSLENVEYFEL